MKTVTSIGVLFVAHCTAVAAPNIGTRVAPPSERGHTVEAVRESGERGGLLLNVGTNFTARYNRDMGEAMELWNAHRWGEAAERFRHIRLTTPESPWAAEAELHEACFHKFNARYDEAEARFIALLAKYPQNLQLKGKILHYLPDVYARSGRLAAAMDALQNLRDLPLSWQEQQFLENYTRIYARALKGDDADRLCGAKALALAMESQNAAGQSLRNVSLAAIYQKHDWALEKASDPAGYSLDDLAQRAAGRPLEVSLDELRRAAGPGHPVLVHLKTPAEPKAFTHLRGPARAEAGPLTGHFVVVESVGEGVVDLLDPDGGRTRWLLAHFLARWSGVVLELPGQTPINDSVLPRERAAALRGGCCGNPPLDPTNEGSCGADGAGGVPGGPGGPGVGPGGGPMAITQGAFGGPAGATGGNMGGCPTCGGAGGGGSDGGECSCGAGAPVYSFGLASANLQLNDIPIWYPAAKGPDRPKCPTRTRPRSCCPAGASSSSPGTATITCPSISGTRTASP